MRAYFAVFVAVALMLSSGVVPVRSQSLGDLARKEEERRKSVKTVKNDGRVLTNKDVPRVPQTSAPVNPAEPADAEPKDATAAPAASEAAAAPGDAKAPADVAVKDQKYWSERRQALQAQLDRDQVLADALQSRVNALNGDFAKRDDPAQRTVIGNERQKAIDELGRLNASIVLHKKAIADFEEEARRAAVPPGWLR